MMHRGITYLLLVLFSAVAINTLAGGHKKKKHAFSDKAWDPYGCCHNMTDTPNRPVSLEEKYLFPEFYFPDTLSNRDTDWVFKCYDTRDSELCMDTIHDFAQVRYVSLFKNFIDSLHTYKDNGIHRPLPVSIIVKRYDRLAGTSKWMCIIYPGNKYSELKEYPAEIVKSDTVVDESKDKRIKLVSIYSYYKVAAAW